jgi:enolase-phosphatase E1
VAGEVADPMSGIKAGIIKAIVTDIEGTTSSIAFVHEVLFPYASKMLPAYIREHAVENDVAQQLVNARFEAGEPSADTERTIEILLQWIREDRKATPLKALQGMVWKQGYERGDFTGHIYEDAVRNLEKWKQAGIDLYIYSSGSVQAQKLMFGHSDAGDLLYLFTDYFDTRIGQKKEAASYRDIARTIGRPAEEILFLSDVVEELDAAREAGMQTLQLVRTDNMITGTHETIPDFDVIEL